MASFVVFEDPVLAPGDGHAAALQQKAGEGVGELQPNPNTHSGDSMQLRRKGL